MTAHTSPRAHGVWLQRAGLLLPYCQLPTTEITARPHTNQTLTAKYSRIQHIEFWTERKVMNKCSF